MPVSLSEWRIRIGRYLKRQKKEYDYNHFLAKIFNLLKRTYNVKFPSDARVPSRSTKNGTNNDAQNNSVPKSHCARNSSGSSTPSTSTASKPAAAFINLRDQETSVITSTVNIGSINVETTPPLLSVDEYKDREQSCSSIGDDELDDRYITIGPQSQTTVQSFKQDNSSTFLLQSDKDSGIPFQSRKQQREEDTNLHYGMSRKNIKTYAPYCPVYDDDELDCREITIIPDIGFSSQGILTQEQPAPRPCHTVFHNVMENSLLNLSNTSFTQGNLEEVSSNRKSECSTSQTPQANINECPDVTSMLLLRSGDVELNPGPNNSVTEEKLEEIASKFPHDHYYSFSKKLGIGYNQAEQILAKNLGDYQRALMKNLMTWKNRTGGPYTELSDALANSGARDLVQLLKPSIEPGDEIPDDLLQLVVEDIKHYYKSELCQIAADPVNTETILEFDRIYTNLLLLEEVRGIERPRPLPYKDLLNTMVNGEYPRRLMVEGEGGTGKSTLCAKIAWDWANRKGYKQFKLVLITLLRNSKDMTVGEIAKTYLSDDNPVTAKQLDRYILSHQKEVFLAMDGLDELVGDLTIDELAEDRTRDGLAEEDRTRQHQIVKIIKNRLFKRGTVLITTRKWRSDEIRKEATLKKVFAFLIIEGFSKKDLNTYIERFFHNDKGSCDHLIRFITEDDVIRENMAPFPIYTAMLCIMWGKMDHKSREAMHKLQTFSKVIHEMANFLVDHYLSKHMASSHDAATHEKRLQILEKLTQIGKTAFHGLLRRMMVIPEVDFEDKDSLEIGCKVGVLSKTQVLHDRREPAVSKIQFTHKLFQEYLSAMYLASLWNSNHDEYQQLSERVIETPLEYQYLVYFAAALDEKVAMDVVERIILKPITIDDDTAFSWHSSSFMRKREREKALNNFLVDVAYESQDSEVVKKVRDHVMWDWEMRSELNISYDMQAHAVSAHIFVRDLSKVERLRITGSFGRTVSRDLARIMCTSNSLTSASIETTMHDDYYLMLANSRTNFKITYLNNSSDLSSSHEASQNLAEFICNLSCSCLTYLILGGRYGDARAFYSTLSSVATPTKVETFEIGITDISARSWESLRLAEFISKMSCLKTLRFKNYSLHDHFYASLCSMTSTVKIQTLEISNAGLMKRHEASNYLARFICKIPRLKELHLSEEYETSLHDNFYSALSRMASSAKIEIIKLDGLKLSDNGLASREMAKVICKLVFLAKLHLGEGLAFRGQRLEFHDNFYSTLSSMASSVKLEVLKFRRLFLLDHPCASRDLAQFICEVACLHELHLDWLSGSSFNDSFYSTLSSMASSAKIKCLFIGCEDLLERPVASRDLAEAICTMNFLEELTIETEHSECHDDFYSAASSKASCAKTETLVIKRTKLKERPTASRNLAKFVCKMACLKNLTIDDYGRSYDDKVVQSSLHEDFYSALASVESCSRIKTLVIRHLYLSERPLASRNLAQFIRGLHFLKSLTLGCHLHKDFFATLSSQASRGKIETLIVDSERVTACPSASREFAKWICEMTSLKNLTLRRLFGGLHAEFYSTLDTLASVAKIENLIIDAVYIVGRLASFICKLPHLKKLTMGNNYRMSLTKDCCTSLSTIKIETLGMNTLDHTWTEIEDTLEMVSQMPLLKTLTIGCFYQETFPDEFYSALSSRASLLKIDSFGIRLDGNSGSPHASRELANSICKMPHLTNLALLINYKAALHKDFFSTLAACERVDGWRGTSVTELTVAGGLLVDWQHCRPMFDNVRKVRVCVKDTFHVSVIQQIQLPAATELIIQSDEHSFTPVDFSEEPNTLPTVIQRAFPQLTKVTFSDIYIGNGQIESILNSFSSARAQISTIRFLRCGRNKHVDDLIHNFNSHNTIKVEIEHGKPFREEWRR